MKSLLAAVAFLTRIPVGRSRAFDAIDVGHSGGWFPLVGAALGGFACLLAALLKDRLPLGVVGVLLVLVDAIATGAIHFDGLADAADGFGGGTDRDDVLRIMRDHAIGSYGGVALAICVALKVMAYAAVLNRTNWIASLILTPALGRWSILLLTATVPYARSSASPVGSMGKWPLVAGTAIILAALLFNLSVRTLAAAGAVVAVTVCFGVYCRNRISGITGDTLGANVELCECVSLMVFLWTI